jgi:hypothetical protein
MSQLRFFTAFFKIRDGKIILKEIDVMKWITKDVDTYFQAKEYVDTAIIPLIPIQFKDELKSSVVMGEFITLICEGLERELHGRVFQLPQFSYLKSVEKTTHLPHLKLLEEELFANGFSHIFYLTSDVDWKAVESELSSLIWMPHLPLEHLKADSKMEILQEQVKQVMKLLMDDWKKQMDA